MSVNLAPSIDLGFSRKGVRTELSRAIRSIVPGRNRRERRRVAREVAERLTRNIQDDAVKPEIRELVNELAPRVDQLRALGNGVVPLCAATAFYVLMDRAGLVR